MANYEVSNYITDLLDEDNIQLLKSYLKVYKPSKEACELAMKTAKNFPLGGSDIDQFFLRYFETTFANIPAAEDLLKQVQQLEAENKILKDINARREEDIRELRDEIFKYDIAEHAFNAFLDKLNHEDKSESFYHLIQIMDFKISYDNISKLGKWFDLSGMVFKNHKTVINVLEYLLFDGDIERRKNFVLVNRFTDFKGLAKRFIDYVEEYIEQITMIEDFKEFLILNGQQTFEREFEREFEIAVAKHFITKHVAREEEVFKFDKQE
jgi:hypothetical protein